MSRSFTFELCKAGPGLLLFFLELCRGSISEISPAIVAGRPTDCWFQMSGRITQTFPDAWLGGPAWGLSPSAPGLRGIPLRLKDSSQVDFRELAAQHSLARELGWWMDGWGLASGWRQFWPVVSLEGVGCLSESSQKALAL